MPPRLAVAIFACSFVASCVPTTENPYPLDAGDDASGGSGGAGGDTGTGGKTGTIDPTIGGPCSVDADCDDLIGCTIDACDLAIDKCRFIPDEGGSFTIEHADPKRTVFFGEIMSVSVTIISPGVAEVRGLTRQGVNSRWGEARRMANDRACWQGSDFKICAR